jgi:hypothetical protein
LRCTWSGIYSSEEPDAAILFKTHSLSVDVPGQIRWKISPAMSGK